MKPYSWKSNIRHATLEYLIKELDSAQQDLSRSGITNRAISVAKEMTKDASEDEKKKIWTKVMEELPKLPKMEISVPTAMQIKPDDELETDLKSIEEDIKKSLGLKTLQTQYEIQLLWMNYLDSLKVKVINVGKGKNLQDKDNFTGPEMVQRLVQILMLNRNSDTEILEKVKAILLEWEE